MIAANELRRAQTALKSRDAQRRHELLDAVGWEREGADVVWTSARSGLGQCHLGSYPTAASVDIPQDPKRVTNGWWEPSYFGDFHWCVQLAPGLLRWCDLHAERVWTCRADELTDSSLQGLTPEHFASRGRFEPLGVPYERLKKHPGKRATEYFVGKIQDWFVEYLVPYGPSSYRSGQDFARRVLILSLPAQESGRAPSV
jgi:hypothetical protein